MNDPGWKFARSLGFLPNFDDYANALFEIADLYESLYGGPPKQILDTGYGWGLSCAVWLHRWPHCRVTCISPDRPGEYSCEADGIAPLTDACKARFEFIAGRAEDAAMLVPARTFDMVMLDTEHLYPAQFYQMQATWPLLRAGGFYAGHDYDQTGVCQGTDEFLESIGATANLLRAGDGHDFFWLQKGE